jgi:heterotetrameric sarcosine oxidase gamma subunit
VPRSLTPRLGLERVAVPGHLGPAGDPGVVIALRSDMALASVMARKDCHDVLARRVRDVFGLDLPAASRRSAFGPTAFAWAGPDHWLATADAGEGHAFEARLRTAVAGLASISDQSDGRIVMRVSGPRARDALAKGLPIDLHPRGFGAGDSAVTTIAHIGVHLWQLDAAPTYEFAVFRSFAAAFWHWLVAASAEFGVTCSANA